MPAWRILRLTRHRRAAGWRRRVGGRSAKCAALLAILAFFSLLTAATSHACPEKRSYALLGAIPVAAEGASWVHKSRYGKSTFKPVVAKHRVRMAQARLAAKGCCATLLGQCPPASGCGVSCCTACIAGIATSATCLPESGPHADLRSAPTPLLHPTALSSQFRPPRIFL